MKQKFIEWFTKKNNGCSPAMEDDRSFVREKSQHMFEAYQAGVAEGEARCAALAAENGQMLRLLTDISENHDEYVNQDEYLYAGVPMDYVSEINSYVSRDVEAENPFKETDAFLAEVRALARNEGINYAASRLAAAFNHGFVDKPLTEVCDVVRMILDTKEELENSTLPAADGLSGELAEEFIENSTVELRKGVRS
ncbi:hypothetical protein [Enterobacter ludwigii]|uniref:hypothetical protein n=1 Tax=Enterobacter ludwigii TaxID=299767 RepID=UPI001868B41C|nr:hypothetical protein [Enterobacter ludwigii]